MVPEWISRRPRDVPTQRQQRTKAEIFQFRRGTYFSQIVELFRVIVPNARNWRDRHRRDGVSTWNRRKLDMVSPRGVSQKIL
jgi:hypothetical protein